MADPSPTNSPAVALENPQTTSNFNPEPASKEEPQDHMAIPLPAAPLPGLVLNQLDTEMTDVAVSYDITSSLPPLMDPKPSPVAHPPSATPTSVTHRTATPTRNTNGQTEASPMPLKAAAHGAPARRYLNDKVTGVLLEGMKRLVIEQ